MDKSAKIEKFLVADYEFTQLSDHYGAMVSLEYFEDPEISCKKKEKHENHVKKITF